MIPYGKQEISKDDIQSVIKTLKSDWLKILDGLVKSNKEP